MQPHSRALRFKGFALGRILVIPLAFLTVMALVSVAAGGVLVGDQVQNLGGNVKWIKGEPVPEFKRGQVYVVDIWGTWCPPCLADIPHLNATAIKYRDKNVSVIGIALPIPGTIPTDEFVKKKGDGMSYIVAEDIDSRITNTFKDVLGGSMFPTLAIIDRQGRLAWMGRGYPIQGFGEALEKVVDGTYDLRGAVNESDRQNAIKIKAHPLLIEMDDAWKAHNVEKALDALRQLIVLDRGMFSMSAPEAYMSLRQLGPKDRAVNFAREVVDQLLTANDPSLAWALGTLSADILFTSGTHGALVVRKGLDADELDLALRAAMRSNEITGEKDPWRLQSLAMAYFAKGEHKQAATLMTRSVENAQSANWGEEELDKLRKMLTEYRDGPVK
jgi:thiol-disulfide isomerase/thioredoxin